MQRIWNLDALSFTLDILNDESNGLNAMLDKINAERKLSTPKAEKIHYGPKVCRYPEVLVKSGENATFQAPSVNIPADDILGEDSEIHISVYLKSAHVELTLWKEVYLEALVRLLHNRQLNERSRITVSKTIRDSQSEGQLTEETVKAVFKVTVR